MELGQDALECKEVMKLIEHAGLMKSVTSFGKYYEVLVKELIVNIPADCDDNRSKEFKKVFVRGKCVEFSPNVINRYMGICEDEQPEIEVTDNQVCKENTVKQVVQWPRKGKLPVGKLSVMYEILHRIGASNRVPTNHTSTITTGLGKFIYVVGTKTNFDFGDYVFEQTLKHASTCRSGEESTSSTSKASLIVKLKDTYKALDDTIKTYTERKTRLERLIKSLAEESPGENVAGDYEEGDEEEEDVVVGATSTDESYASADI
ncbi:uncharacterized protein LOC127100891 [Lathyrus oleraceus]|uniref:uncharacterized protein LOC127100891 n=1 Tax=Pisum sativum TaxID=3888 RepID=UPI0021D2FF3D|nr:uncharacterized protein LOC127100891 [Pisum sativum]